MKPIYINAHQSPDDLSSITNTLVRTVCNIKNNNQRDKGNNHRERKSPLFSKYGNLGTIFVTILY